MSRTKFEPKFLTHLETRYIGGGFDKLLIALLFEYEPTKVVKAEEGSVTNFASIPRVFRWLITGQDNTKRGAALHDDLYKRQPKGVNRKFADQLFLKAMLSGPDEMRVKKWKANLAYAGVRVGGWNTWRKYAKDKLTH